MAGQNVLDAVNKAKELSILAEDLVRLILVRIPTEHAATLILDETKVDGKTPAAFLAGKAGVSEDTAERALLAAQSRLAEKFWGSPLSWGLPPVVCPPPGSGVGGVFFVPPPFLLS